MDFEKELKKYHADALSIAEIHDYKITEKVFVGAHGTPHTRFQAASVSKMVFAAAVLRLAADNKMLLDDDISTYLGGLTPRKVDGTPAKATARQILTHTAGFNVHGFDGYPVGANIPSAAQIIAGEAPCNSSRILQEYEPGRRWRYSSGGFMVLQKCVENITGNTLPDLMEDLIFGPLEMSDSTFRQDVSEHIAAGYSAGKAVPGGHRIMPELAAAGLWTTPSDLAKFGIHLQKILRGETGIIPQRLVQEMVTPYSEAAPDLGKTGLGCYIKVHDGMEYFGHTGDNIGFASQVLFSICGGDGICILVNSDDAFPLVEQISAQHCVRRAGAR